MINPLFAKKHNIKIGSKIRVADKEYNICGFALRLDYMFCLKNPNDTFSNADVFGIGIVTENEFNSFNKNICTC